MACSKEKRQLVQDEIRAAEEEGQCSKMVGVSKQEAWNRWEHAEFRKITWAKLWKVEPSYIIFLVKSVDDDVLPSQANLHTWVVIDTPEGKLY